MKPTDFSKYLTKFLSEYLTVQKNVSPNTIKSYRDTFKLLLCFSLENGLPVEKITMQELSAGYIKNFLNWLENERNNSISTRNTRLAAIHSFFRYAQIESPESLYHYQQILAIPIKNKNKQAIVKHLSADGIKLLLEQPDKSTARGRRDLALLSLMYDSGARVQEIIDLTVKDFTTGGNPTLTLFGKGSKIRRIPIMNKTATIVEKYIAENNLNLVHKSEYPLFTNPQNNKLTKEGVAYILSKYARTAHTISDKVPARINCHMLRHSKAVHLLHAGVNLIYIRDFLGHSEIKSTEIYARADSEIKRKALENAYPELVDSNLPDWSENGDLMDWLSQL